MSINSEALQRKLYDLLDNKGYNPKPMDSTGKITPVPEEAAVIKFDFIKDGENYGKVWISIDGSKKLKIYYGDSVSSSPSDNTSGTPYSDSWTGLISHLKNWAQRRQLSFELRNENHLEADMAQREHMDKKERVSEGYYPMGKSASYSDAVPSVKIVIEHSRKIEEGEQRYRNINRIFVENANGERFLLNTTKPGIARVYARHIAEGGTPYDDRGQHIKGLVEEYSKMAGFVRATRNGQFNESSQKLIAEGVNHYNSLRETLSRMSGKRGYDMYFESWTPSLMEDDSDTTAVNELFVQETVDPRIEPAMPILAKLSKNISEMAEVTELAEWADSLLEGGDGGEASEETDGDTEGDAGEGGAGDVDDDITEAAGAETLAHNEKTEAGNLKAFGLAEEGDGGQTALNPQGIPEGMLDGSGDVDSPVASAILRRILMQRLDLLSKYGPEKVSNAIGDVADFVGDVDEIGSSDVSGWIKHVERSLDGMTESDEPEAYDEFASDTFSDDSEDEILSPDTYELIDEYIAKIEPDADREEIAQSILDGTIHTSELEYALQPDLEEGIIDKIKDVGQKALNTLGHGSDEDLLKDLKIRAGVRNPQNGKPSMAHSDVEKVDEDEFAGNYATGEAGQWRNKGPKANKPATIGDLVGENFINTDAQAVVSEMDKSEDRKGPEGKAKPITGKKMASDSKKVLDKQFDKAHKKDVKESQDDLAAMLRIINR